MSYRLQWLDIAIAGGSVAHKGATFSITRETKLKMVETENRIAYDLRELSEKLQLSERTIRKYINSGKLQAFKLGLKYYVTQESIDQYFDTPCWEWD